MSALALRANEVTKSFGDKVAVDHVSLEVTSGELVALVGPSGCGKSTLLRTIAGLHSTEAGTIELGGRVVDDGSRSLPPEDRGIGLVFQDHALFPHLSVADNVGFGIRPAKGRKERVGEMLELVGLAHCAQRFPHELSGGERQRIALARALATKPGLMLLDEPFASLDPNLRAQIRHDIVSILRETGTPAVFVTHDQGEALAIGDKVAVMSSGQIVQLGSPDDVFHHPINRFVAAFMGEAAFITADDARESFAIENAGLESGQLLMMRPDDAGVIVDPDGSAVVDAREFRGSMWSYAVTLASGKTVWSIQSHLVDLPVGTRVRTHLKEGHLPVPVNEA